MASAGRFWSHRIAENGSAGAQLIGWAVVVVGSSTGGQVVVDLVAHSCSFSRTRGARIELQQTKNSLWWRSRQEVVMSIASDKYNASLHTKVSFIRYASVSVWELYESSSPNHVSYMYVCLYSLCVLTLTSSLLSSDSFLCNSIWSTLDMFQSFWIL